MSARIEPRASKVLNRVVYLCLDCATVTGSAVEASSHASAKGHRTRRVNLRRLRRKANRGHETCWASEWAADL